MDGLNVLALLTENHQTEDHLDVFTVKSYNGYYSDKKILISRFNLLFTMCNACSSKSKNILSD